MKIVSENRFSGKTYFYAIGSCSSGQLVIQSHVSVLHVEQEVTGDDTLALQSVLESDEKREGLLKEERQINAQMAEG